MKKAIAIFLLPLFLTATTGLVLTKHYCGGKLKDTGITVMDSKTCCGEEEMPSDCCNNEHEFFKVDADFVGSASEINFNDIDVTFLSFLVAFSYDLVSVNLHSFNYSNHSPPLLEQNIPILVQSFLL